MEEALMMNVTEARDLVERCIGRAVAADQVQPGTGFMELYRCLGLEVQQFLAQRAVALLSPPLDAGLVGSMLVRSFELNLAILSLVILVWTFWVLEGKGIWHKGQPDVGWRYVLEERIVETLDELLKAARNLAIDDKRTQQAAGAVPGNVGVPQYYQDWRQKIGRWP